MKLLHFGELAEGGVEVRVNVSSTEDIWHLYHMIAVGDVVRTKTRRKVVKETSAGKAASDILTLNIAIEITDPVEYDPVGLLRAKGINKTESPHIRMNQSHTLEIVYDPPQDLTLHKRQWDELHAAHLREALDEDGRADTAAILMQSGLAHVCLVTSATCVVKAKIETATPKKRKGFSNRDEQLAKFFQQIVDAAVQHIRLDRIKLIMIGSPGHLREEFVAYLVQLAAKAEASPGVKALAAARSRFVLAHVSSGGRHAFNEALGDPNVAALMSETKWAEDEKRWDEFVRTMAKADEASRCTYGAQTVFDAQKEQAVGTLFLCDESVRLAPTRERKFYTLLADDVRLSGGDVTMLSSQHAAGAQLQKMGGVAALLRLPMPHLDDVEMLPNFFDTEDVGHFIATASAGGTASSGRTLSSGRTNSDD